MTGVITYMIAFDALPELDRQGRPKMFYSQRLHDKCYRRPHFDAGQFVERFDDEGARKYHIVFWGVALAFVVGSMLILGGIEAIRITMIIGALPFSFVVLAMSVSILKAVAYDLVREHHGVPCTAQECEDWDGTPMTSD